MCSCVTFVFCRVMVSFQDKERKVGVSAESIQRSNLARTVMNLKFFLGRNYDEVKKTGILWSHVFLFNSSKKVADLVRVLL